MNCTDLHIHMSPGVTAESLLKSMDEAGLEKIGLISAYGKDLLEQENNIEEVSRIISHCPERIYGLAWIEPAHNTPAELLERVIANKGYRGFKMIPNGWYPYEDKIISYCEKIAAIGVPCLFHSGILYFPTLSSRYCRPVYFEELIKIPNFRFALAHISWPWTDECLALYGQTLSLRGSGFSSAEMFIDITPGTPPDYREEALRRLFNFSAESVSSALIFGTDLHANMLEVFKNRMAEEMQVFEKLQLAPAVIRKITYDNFHRFFGEQF